MRYATAICATALSGLACVFANAPAKADVFDFSFGPDAIGTFTTGAAANDPGYELITGLTFTHLVDPENNFSLPKMTGQNFASGAAFNSPTDAFINHSLGGTFNNIGDFKIVGSGALGIVQGDSFAQFSTALTANINGALFVVPAALEIAQSPTTAIPEVSTWAMMLLGFGGIAYAGFRRSSKARLA
jgi:hypothetical protein